MPTSFRIGARYRVCEGSGCDSRRVGTVVDRREVPTDGRGIPKILGHYKPMQSNEVALRDDSGAYFTMYKNRLIPVRD